MRFALIFLPAFTAVGVYLVIIPQAVCVTPPLPCVHEHAPSLMADSACSACVAAERLGVSLEGMPELQTVG